PPAPPGPVAPLPPPGRVPPGPMAASVAGPAAGPAPGPAPGPYAPPPRASGTTAAARAAAVALVGSGAAVLGLSTLVPWAGRTALVVDGDLRPTGILVLVVAAQWVLLVAHPARRGARACFVGMIGVLGVGMAASATRTAADISA